MKLATQTRNQLWKLEMEKKGRKKDLFKPHTQKSKEKTLNKIDERITRLNGLIDEIKKVLKK